MLSSKLILTAFLFSTASIAQLPSLKISNPKVATSPSSCTNKNAENATKLSLPPFIDVSNSEPNAASKPGSQPLSNQYGGGGARVVTWINDTTGYTHRVQYIDLRSTTC